MTGQGHGRTETKLEQRCSKAEAGAERLEQRHDTAKGEAERLEIMAPAGNFECLTAAIQSGADSVYFGVEKLNMRSHSANNFSMEDLSKAHLPGSLCKKLSYPEYCPVSE